MELSVRGLALMKPRVLERGGGSHEQLPKQLPTAVIIDPYLIIHNDRVL